MFTIGETRPNCDANEPQEDAQGTRQIRRAFEGTSGSRHCPYFDLTHPPNPYMIVKDRLRWPNTVCVRFQEGCGMQNMASIK